MSALANAGVKINAAHVAAPFREALQANVRKLTQEVLGGEAPVLVGFLANNDVAAKKYANWTKRACEKDGIKFELRECTMLELESKLREANADPAVHGIMIYYPCFGGQPSFFGGTMDDHLRDSVSVEKDVEGLTTTYRQYLYKNIRHLPLLDGAFSDKKCILPCTPLAIVKILEHLNVYDSSLPLGERLSGQVATVINRSEIVGRPLGAMLANDGAKVYSVDINSIYIMERARMTASDVEAEQACRKSDIIITGVPAKAYRLPTSWVKPGTVVINVSNYKNVDETELLKIEGVRYVPLVGKVTVAMLERNLVRLVNNFRGCERKCRVVDVGGRVVYVDENDKMTQ